MVRKKGGRKPGFEGKKKFNTSPAVDPLIRFIAEEIKTKHAGKTRVVFLEAQVCYSAFYWWLRRKRSPRLDSVRAIYDAIGYDIIPVKRISNGYTCGQIHTGVETIKAGRGCAISCASSGKAEISADQLRFGSCGDKEERSASFYSLPEYEGLLGLF